MAWIIIACVLFILTVVISVIRENWSKKLSFINRRKYSSRYIFWKGITNCTCGLAIGLVIRVITVSIIYDYKLDTIAQYNAGKIELTMEEKFDYNDWITKVYADTDNIWTSANLYNTINPGFTEDLDYIW